MYSRKMALSLARQIRRCPPPAVIKDPSQADQVEHHLAVCPHCAEESMAELDASQRLAEKILDARKAPAAVPGIPAARGQVRYLSSRLGGWRDGFYCNPPVVLVLEVMGVVADEIRVAQVYDDPVLAGPGDLILDAGRTGGAGELFVECWNTYTSRAEHLGSFLGQVSPDTVEAVTTMAENPEMTPDWAMMPFPMTEDGPRQYFRRLEVEVAYTFASQAAGELMAALEQAPVKLVYESPESLRQAIEKKVPGIRFPGSTRSHEDLLACAQFPMEMLRFAAADSVSRTITGSRVVFMEGELDRFENLRIELYPVHESARGTVSFSGKFPVDRQNGPPVEVLFRFIDSDDTVLEPVDAHWDGETGHFTVEFSTVSADWKNLRMAIVYGTIWE
jgi:hypothetical protein